MISFVYPFWQAGASYDELRWSIRSIYQHFKSDEPFEVIVVGDQPILRRWKHSWFTGRVIPAPRIVTGGAFRDALKDALHKWNLALSSENISETIVWMMDDIFLVKDVTLQDLQKRRAFAAWNPKTLMSRKAATGFQAAKLRTMQYLVSIGRSTHDFATHLPHVVDKSKALELMRNHPVQDQGLLWEVLYENIYGSGPVLSAGPFLRYYPRAHRLNVFQKDAQGSSVLVPTAAAWCEDLRAFLYQHLPTVTPVESDSPIPPKMDIVTPPLEKPIEVPVVHKSRPLVTCVMNGWGKPAAFPCQIESLRKQTVGHELMVWQNHHDTLKQQWHRDWFDAGRMTHAGCNQNLGVWARFAFALNARTEYVCVFDDDVFPGPQWLAHCLETIKVHNGLLGGNGVIFHSQTDYNNRTNYGWAYPNKYAVHVDIVGHAWFVRREWLGLYWSEMPDLSQPVIAGEDFHFSYMLQKHGIRTFVPQHRKGHNKKWSCESPKKGFRFGRAPAALSKHPEHSQTIQNGLSLYVQKGFKLIEFPGGA